MSETLAIIGRPNVGKSTLFNRLIGRRLALVANEPGITRDYRVEKLNIKNHSYELIDTAGIEELSKDNIDDQKRFLLNHKVEVLKSISIN